MVVNVGPVHLELFGSIEAIAAAKAELIAALPDAGTAIVPADEPLLGPYLSDRIEVVTFGPGGDVHLTGVDGERVEVEVVGQTVTLELPFSQAHLRTNLLAALAAAHVVGVAPSGRVEVAFSPGRGQRLELPDGITLVDDCYNANPMSMRAALDDLIATADGSRTVAVLGDMLELGPAERQFHVELGEHARRLGIDMLVTVGELAAAIGEGFDGEAYAVADAGEAAALVPELLEPGDVILVKASRGVGLELVAEALVGGAGHDRAARSGQRIDLGRVLIAGTASLLMCLFLSPRFIEFLRAREFGQNIREEGPQGHQQKAGTPTMGGIIIIMAIAVPFLVLSKRDWISMGVFGVIVASALLGFADDYTKIVKRRSLGLRARTKLVVTIAISVWLWWVATQKVGHAPEVRIRFVDVSIDLGPLYPVFIYLVVAGTTTAVNFADGLDGLAAGCAAIVLLAYVAITYITGGESNLTLLAACLVGACIAFLWFNSFPASIFMGDTGSLGLGGAIAGLAVMTQTEMILILLGGVFVLEVVSVMIQVVSFQMFRKRVFLMTPIHHHFELAGWSETKIILRFWIVAAACAAIGFTVYQLSIRG